MIYQREQVIKNIKHTYSWLDDETLDITYQMALNNFLMLKYPTQSSRPKIENLKLDFVDYGWIEARMRDILSRAGISLSSYKENNLNLTYGSSFIDPNLASMIKPMASVPK